MGLRIFRLIINYLDEFIIHVIYKNVNLSTFLCLLVPAVKQMLAPGIRTVQVLSHTSADAQKNKLKEAGGGTFKCVQIQFHQCFSDIGVHAIGMSPYMFKIPRVLYHLSYLKSLLNMILKAPLMPLSLKF